MSDPVVLHRLQFAFTIIYHYLFPHLTMGLALLIVVMKALGLRTGRRERGTTRRASGSGSSGSTSRSASSPASRWSSSSAPTGRASRATRATSSARRSAMEGLFAFFLESTLPGRCWSSGRSGCRGARPLPRGASPCSPAAGSRATSSSRPTPSCSTRSATRSAPDGHAAARRLLGLPPEPVGARAVRAQHGRDRRDGVVRRRGGRRVLRSCRAGTASRRACSCALGVVAGLVVERARRLSDRRPPGQARRARTSRSRSPRWRAASRAGPGAEHHPDRPAQRARAPARQPDRGARASCRFLAFGTSTATCAGLDEFPEDDWPDNIELLYYAFHVMVGLGTILDRRSWLIAAPARLDAGGSRRCRADALGADARVSRSRTSRPRRAG